MFIALDKLINLHDGYRRLFIVEHQQLLLIQEEGRRYLIQAQCPHMQWPLAQGRITQGEIECAKHRFSFDLITGKPTSDNAQQCSALRSYRLHYQDNSIGLMGDSL